MARHTELRADQPPPPDRCCEHCGRPHGHTLRCLPDGRWLSPDGLWFGSDGDPAPWPDVVDYSHVRTSRSVVGLYRRHRASSEPQTLCRRCFMMTEKDTLRNLAKVRTLMRFAMGDLFDGAYTA